MNVYCVNDGDAAMLIAAESRGQCRAYATHEWDCEFTAQISMRLLERNVDLRWGYVDEVTAEEKRVWKEAFRRGWVVDYEKSYDETCPDCSVTITDIWEYFRGCDPPRDVVEVNCPHCGIDLRIETDMDPEVPYYVIEVLPTQAYQQGSEVYD